MPLVYATPLSPIRQIFAAFAIFRCFSDIRQRAPLSFAIAFDYFRRRHVFHAQPPICRPLR